MSDVARPEPRAVGNLFGREDAIRQGRCLACDSRYTREQISMWPTWVQKEHAVTGLCWSCLIGAFEIDNTRCTCDQPCCEADVGVGVYTCGSQHCLVHGVNPP